MIGYDASTGQLYVDRSQSGRGLKNAQYAVDSVGLEPQNGTVKLQILLDGSSLEVFGNDGRAVLTAMIYPDADATGLSLFATAGTATVKQLTVWDLSRLKTDATANR